jgi:hypothetical protein
MAPLLRLTDVRKTFGGLVAVNALSFEIEAGGDRGHDRTERRRQVDGVQPDHRRLRAHLRPRSISTAARSAA